MRVLDGIRTSCTGFRAIIRSRDGVGEHGAQRGLGSPHGRGRFDPKLFDEEGEDLGFRDDSKRDSASSGRDELAESEPPVLLALPVDCIAPAAEGLARHHSVEGDDVDEPHRVPDAR
jgi:hypothetical protein